MNEYQVLRLLLEKDIWSDELLGQDFKFLVERKLGLKERIVLEMKVEGYGDGEILRLTMQTRESLHQMKNRIKRKLLHGMNIENPDLYSLVKEEYPLKKEGKNK